MANNWGAILFILLAAGFVAVVVLLDVLGDSPADEERKRLENERTKLEIERLIQDIERSQP